MLDGVTQIPFRRMTDPLLLPVAPTAQKFDVPAGYFLPGGAGNGAATFWICNANSFWVRLKGSGNGMDGTGPYVAVTDTTGWCFPPGYTGPFTTQFPLFMSVMSVTRQGLTAGNGTVELSYGIGL